MTLSVDGQNQRKKYFNKYHVNINKNKRIKRKNKVYKYRQKVHQKKRSFQEKNRRQNKRVYYKD